MGDKKFDNQVLGFDYEGYVPNFNMIFSMDIPKLVFY